MEHLCYKCQASIDEALPFCPHCGAPQIRVASPEEETATQSPASDSQNPQASGASWITGTTAYQPNAIQWEFAWKGALLSGLMAALLSATPLVGLGCFLWLLGAGALAVWLYQRRVPGAIVTSGMGMRIGALTGSIGYVASAIWIVFQFARNSQELRTVFVEQMDKTIASNPDPKAQEILQQFMSRLNTPEGMATLLVLILVCMAIVFVLFSTAGGALGASMFRRSREIR